jgi:hypothetical protein
LFSFNVAVQCSETEDDAQCRVDAADLTDTDKPDTLAERARRRDESWRHVPQ